MIIKKIIILTQNCVGILSKPFDLNNGQEN